MRAKAAHATAKSALLEAVTEELSSVKSKLAARGVECAIYFSSAHSVANGASKVEDDMTNELMAVSGVLSDATTQMASIIELVQKDILTRASAQIVIESQAAISHIQGELDLDDSKALPNVVAC